MGESEERKITMRIYKVRRQTNWLDDSTALKRTTTFATYDQPLVVGNLYELAVDGKRGFYRVEELIAIHEIDR